MPLKKPAPNRSNLNLLAPLKATSKGNLPRKGEVYFLGLYKYTFTNTVLNERYCYIFISSTILFNNNFSILVTLYVAVSELPTGHSSPLSQQRASQCRTLARPSFSTVYKPRASARLQPSEHRGARESALLDG
jgi:hypothetical protein